MFWFIVLFIILYLFIKLSCSCSCSCSEGYYSSSNTTYKNSSNKDIDNFNLSNNNYKTNNFIIQDYKIMMENDFSLIDYNGKVYYKTMSEYDSDSHLKYVTDESGDMYTIYNHNCNNSNYYDLSSYNDYSYDEDDTEYWGGSATYNSWYSYGDEDDNNSEWY